jgi:hypothetical protein
MLKQSTAHKTTQTEIAAGHMSTLITKKKKEYKK